MSPAVIVGLVFGFLLTMVGFVRLLRDPGAAWMLLIGMIMFTGFAVQVDQLGNQCNHTWLEPLQVYRAQMYLGFGTLMFVGLMVHISKARLNTMPTQGLFLLTIQIVSSMLKFYHDGAADAAQTLVFSLVTMPPVMLLLPMMLKDWSDWTQVIRAIALTGLLWGGATSVQVLLNHHELILGWQDRFTGMLGNPQGCGLFMAPITVATMWLILNDNEKKYRPLWFGILGMMLTFSLWTGSRTCVAVTSLGMLFVLYSKLGKMVLFLPIILGLFYGVFQLALALGLSADAVGRLGSTQDTRGVVWGVLFEDAFENPILGSGFKGTRANENSYLVAFGAYGFSVGLLVLALTAYSFALMMKVIRYRRLLPPGHKQIADLILGFNAMYFGGAMFEWYIISRLEGMVIYMLIFSTITKAMLDKLDAEVGWRAAYGDTVDEYAEPVEQPYDQDSSVSPA